MENFKHAFDIESYVYYTQIMQAEALASAFRLWRREWRGPNKEYVGGGLVWQVCKLNLSFRLSHEFSSTIAGLSLRGPSPTISFVQSQLTSLSHVNWPLLRLE